MTAPSPFPHVLDALPDVDADYTLAINGTWCRDTACTATLFSRNIFEQLCAVFSAEAALLAAQGRQLAVVGAVAWITDRAVLATLAEAAAAGVCLIVQKEPWLRPAAFGALRAFTRRQLFGTVLPPPASAGAINDTPVAAWCAGHINATQAVSWPRMHRKTLILCYVDADSAALVPYATWTGSYNLTDTSRLSVEDAILVHSTDIAAFAYREFLCLLAHAEPLASPPL
jgi:hypothetical protein